MDDLTADMIEEAARVQPDRVLATAFLDPVARPRVITLALFAHELARARAVVSEPALALIRLQWWRDTLDQIYAGGPVRAQPVAVALGQVVQEMALPRVYFDQMIDAYAREAEASPFATWADVEAFLDATQGHLNRLCLLASGLPVISQSGDQASRACGIAWGYAGLLANLPQWCMRRATWLPSQAHDGLDLESLYGGAIDAKLHSALAQILPRMTQARHAANVALKTADLGNAFPVLAPACLAQTYAKRHLPKAGQALRLGHEMSLLERQLRLVWAVARGRV